MKLKRKRLLFGRASTPLLIGVFWIFLFFIGVIYLVLWAYFFGIIAGYIVSDLFSGFVMRKMHPKNTREMFAVNLPAILMASSVSAFVVFEMLSGLSVFYRILFYNPTLTSLVGTSLIIMMLWGKAMLMAERRSVK